MAATYILYALKLKLLTFETGLLLGQEATSFKSVLHYAKGIVWQL